MTFQKPNFLKLREDFPMLKKKMHGKPLIYLDSAATAQKPQIVIDAISNFYQNHYGTVHRAVYELAVLSNQLYQNTRCKIKEFLNAAYSEEIIFTRGTTESINMIAYSFGKAFINKGDEILITAMEHHSNIVPWQILCEDRGAILKVAPIDEKGEVVMDAFSKLLSSKTKLVSFAHVSNSLGTINPIRQMIALSHQAGAKVLIDGAQSAPHFAVDVQDLDIDFFVFSGHKIYGPTGIGILYGKKDLLEQMPPYQGGGDMVEKVSFDKTTYNDLPYKFEAGTPMIAEVVGLGAAIDYINTIGLKYIYEWEHELFDYATKSLEQIKEIKIIGTAQKKTALISFIVEGLHALDIGTLLDLKGIAVRTGTLCAQPVMKFFGVNGTIRASFAFYNTKEEINCLVDALKTIISQLK